MNLSRAVGVVLGVGGGCPGVEDTQHAELEKHHAWFNPELSGHRTYENSITYSFNYSSTHSCHESLDTFRPW